MGGSRLPDGLENPLWGTDIRSPPKKMMTIFEAVQAAKEKRKLALGSSVDVPIQVASPLLVNSPSNERGDAKKSPRWNLLRAGGAAAVALAYASLCKSLARPAITLDDSYGHEFAFHVLRLLPCFLLLLPHVSMSALLPHSLSHV